MIVPRRLMSGEGMAEDLEDMTQHFLRFSLSPTISAAEAMEFNSISARSISPGLVLCRIVISSAYFTTRVLEG
jgi:hypothetical protein